MEIYYDPLDAACKTITGAVPRGEELQLNLFSVPAQGPEPQNPQDSAAAEAFFVLKKDGETERRFPLTKDETGWHIRMRIRKAGLYFYRFSSEISFSSAAEISKACLPIRPATKGGFS